VQWQAKLHRENVYRPQRKETQRGVTAREPVCDLINRSIAAAATIAQNRPQQRAGPAFRPTGCDVTRIGQPPAIDSTRLANLEAFGTACRRLRMTTVLVTREK